MNLDSFYFLFLWKSIPNFNHLWINEIIDTRYLEQKFREFESKWEMLDILPAYVLKYWCYVAAKNKEPIMPVDKFNKNADPLCAKKLFLLDMDGTI